MNKICLLIFFLLALRVVAQEPKSEFDIKSFVEPSANAYSLGRYGFLPLGKYTGSANANVLIYKIDFENLELPLELSYSSNGLRVAEDASDVGLGWSLSSVAVITRKVNGGDDFTPQSSYYRGWLYQPQINLQSFDSFDDLPSTTLNDLTFNSDPCIKTDTEPDLFVANIFGVTLKFILVGAASNNGVPGVRVLNSQTYKVSMISNGFEVVDDQGYIYTFNKTESAVTNSEHSNTEVSDYNLHQFTAAQCPHEIITSWYCTKITSPGGKVLNFYFGNYSIQSFSPPSFSSYEQAKLFQGDSEPSLSFDITTSVTRTSLVLLDSVSDGTTTVRYGYQDRDDLLYAGANRPKRLTSVSVFFNGKKKISANLYQSYFNNNKINHAQKAGYLRLKLDSVHVQGREYRFEYYEPDQLPIKSSSSVDAWGYYNGKENNRRYPSFYQKAFGQYLEMRFTGGDLRADPAYARISCLKKFYYPTGGYTEFNYEGHTAVFQGDTRYDWATFEFEESEQKNKYSDNPSYHAETYDFTITESVDFASVNVRDEPALMEFIFERAGYDIPIDTNEIRMAFRIVNLSTGTTVYSKTFEEYVDACYIENCNSCWCFALSRKFRGTLTAGSYRVELYAVQALNTKLKLRLPKSKIPGVYVPTGVGIGGVRVRTISDYSEVNQLLSQRDFRYVESNGITSSGVLMRSPVFLTNNMYYYSFGRCYPSCTPSYYVTLSSVSNSPVSYAARGSHVGYSRVEEIFKVYPDSTKDNKLVTTFVNAADVDLSFIYRTLPYPVPTYLPTNDPQYFYFDTHVGISAAASISMDFKNGSSLVETYLDNTGSEVKRIESKYTELSVGVFPVIRVVSGSYNAPNSSIVTHPPDGYQIYEHPFKRYVLDSTIVTTFSNGKKITERSKFNYTDRWLVRSNIHDADSGILTSVVKYYPTDYAIACNELVQRNIISVPVKLELSRGANQTQGQLREYDLYGRVLRVHQLESTVLGPAPIHDPNASSVMMPFYVKKMDYAYDNATVNINQYTSDSAPVVSILYGYSGKLPVAKVVGADYATVASIVNLPVIESPPDDNALRTELNKLRQAPALQQCSITTYTYNPEIGVTSITDSNARITFYEYDEHGRLVTIRDHDGNVVKHYTYNYYQNRN